MTNAQILELPRELEPVQTPGEPYDTFSSFDAVSPFQIEKLETSLRDSDEATRRRYNETNFEQPQVRAPLHDVLIVAA